MPATPVEPGTKIDPIVADTRRLRPWITFGLILLIAAIALRLVAGYAENRIAARLEREAKTLGLAVRFGELRVGLFPPLRMSDVVIEGPGKAVARIERVSLHPRLRGSEGFGLLAHVAFGRITLTLPAEFEARLNPTSWEADRNSARLETPVPGLSFIKGSGPRGRTYDLRALDLSLDALGAIAVEGAVSKSLGVVNGGVHAEGDPRRDFQATWRFVGFGGETSGSLIVLPGKPEPKTQLQASMKDLDFGHVLRSLGLDVWQ